MESAKVVAARHSFYGEQLSLLEPNVDHSVEIAKKFSAERDEESQQRLAAGRGKPRTSSQVGSGRLKVVGRKS